MTSTPLDSIRRRIASARRRRRGGISYPLESNGTGLFPASHTLEEMRDRQLKKKHRKRRPLFIQRMTNAWRTRLLNAIYAGSLSSQDAEYNEHAPTLDYLWNTTGTAVWGFVFPLLTIVSTQLVGAEEAGKFSLAFVVGTLLMIACNYGIRNFQVSDIEEDHSFASYQINRWLCGIVAIGIGILYTLLHGYDATMTWISLGVYVYKVIDGIADVYEGRLQQADKLYLAGISQTIRSLGVCIVFSLLLFITRSMMVAAIGMGIAAIVSLALLTVPLALLETEKSRGPAVSEIFSLFASCAPLFLALMLFNLIESMPKFVMEGALPYKNQLYFNALYFPAQAILLSIGFVYKPQLLRLSNIWANPNKRKRFDFIVLALIGIVIVIAALVGAFMAAVGVDLLGVFYGLDFERFRTLAYLMVAAGGITAAIDFLYAILTVLRRAGDVTRIYLIGFAASVVLPLVLVNTLGLTGAVVSYVAVMALLLVLLALEYIKIRRSIDAESDPFA